LKGTIIGAVTVIADIVGRDKFMPYLDDTIKLLVSCQEGDLDSEDPQKKYLLTGWMRLCE